MLTLIEKIENGKCVCRCDCGKIVTVNYCHYRSGHTRSCGCLARKIVIARNKRLAKHGMERTRLYKCWASMKSRCYRLNDIDHKWYEGITVCDEWRSDFKEFRDWAMSHGYEEDLTLDRINPENGYYPENCQWVTKAQQQKYNKRNSLSANRNWRKVI